MGKELKRWATTNKVYLLIIGMIILFGYFDAMQIIPFHEINTQAAWDLYNTYTGPAWWITWPLMILAVGIVYYLFSKDKSETIGLVGAGWLMLYTGFEDVIFFVFSKQPPTACMQWFNDANHGNSYWSTYVLGETCVSPLAMYTFAAVGLIAAWYLYKYLKEKY